LAETPRRPSLVTLMLTTAGPYFSTSPLKSGSAATGATLAGAEIAGVETVGGVVAALACIDTLSAVVTPTANAPAIASATALRRKVLSSMVCSLDNLAGMFRHGIQDKAQYLREY